MVTGITATAMGIDMTTPGTLMTVNKGDTVIVATSRMIARPERRSDLVKTIKGILEPARVERGCLSYHLYRDVENRNAFLLLEEWATQADLEKHIRTENQKRLLTLMDILSEQPELQFNTVSHTAGMEFIADVLDADKPV